jgi:hypothetical protein
LPAFQLPPLTPVLDPPGVLPITPKLPLPAVQLEAPPFTPPGFAVSLPVASGFAVDELAVGSALAEVALGYCGYTGCCVCAIAAQGKTARGRIAAKIAIRNARPVFAPFMV